VENSPS